MKCSWLTHQNGSFVYGIFKGLKRQIFAPMNRIINCFWCEHLLQTDNKIGPFPFSAYFQWPYLRVDIWYLCLLWETYPIFCRCCCCCCSALSRPNTIHQICTDEWLASRIPEGMRANWFYRFIPLSVVHAKKKEWAWHGIRWINCVHFSWSPNP